MSSSSLILFSKVNLIVIVYVFFFSQRKHQDVPSGSERCKSWHEEVEPGEGHHVDSQLPEIGIQLAGEPEAGGDAGHGQRHQMVEVTVGGCVQLQGVGADVV